MLLLIVMLMFTILLLASLREVCKGMWSSIKSLCTRKSFAPIDVSEIAHSETPLPEVVQVAQTHPEYLIQDVTATPLVVKQLDQGRATLILRYRVRKQACTAHLIVWSGAKRRRIQDSYYDLGVIARDHVDDEVVEEFLVLAKEKLSELQNVGKKKRQKKAVAVELLTESAIAEPQAVVAEPVVEPEFSSIPDKSVKLKAFPSVFRGTILEVGMMTQNKNGADFEIFGVKFQTPDGIEDAIFGCNLRQALKEAMAGVGDHVEILKIGRKTVEKGRAPMNLFQVSKIAASATVQ